MTHRSMARIGLCVAIASTLGSSPTLALGGAPGLTSRDAPARKFGARLRSFLATGPTGAVPVWVFFTDKGPSSRAAVPPAALVSPRCLQRRSKVSPPSQLADSSDLPVEETYTRRVAERVARLRHRTKWFNGVSVEATPAQITAVAALPFVRSIDLVARYRRKTIEPPADVLAPDVGHAPERPPHSIDYGRSWPQLEIMRVPELHDLGITGQGVLVGHFDDGYRLLSHQSLTQLHVVAAHDFVDGDADPAPNPGDPESFGSHGISTLSVLAGYAPGQLVGAAFGADFVLARTEDDGSETPFEEDHWVAAIEWADSLGVDIVSNSLGYSTFDEGYPSYTWQDMDGETALITRAADMAMARGIAVFAAAGNDGLPVGGRGNTLVAPADARTAITVGGVLPDGLRYWTSSVGPTADEPPRIKPDIMAQGAAIWMAGTVNDDHYAYNAGTSFAAPLAAGVAALLLSVDPQATPLQIRDVLRRTATRSNQPDNQYGWGIVDAVAALGQLSTAVRAANWSSAKTMYR